MRINLSLTLFILLLVSACESSKPFYQKDHKDWKRVALPDAKNLAFTVFLIGDAGEPSFTPIEPNLKFLESQLKEADENSAIIFLGDNIYPAGLLPEDDENREESERLLKVQLDILKAFKGRPFFIPGNHDWNRMSVGGREAVKRQEKFIEDYLGNSKVFYPTDGCGVPKDIKLSDDLTLILLDSQWWLHPREDEPGFGQGCDIQTKEDFEEKLGDLVDDHEDKNIMIVQHHPMYTQGSHNGFFPIKEHLFPLTYLSDNLFIPLPIIGSLHPTARYLGVTRQDLTHPMYVDMVNTIKRATADQEDIIFASGHEHALEYFQEDDHHYIVSGSGTKRSYIKRGYDLQFGYEKEGFAKVYYYKDGSAWLEFWTPAGDGSKGILLFRHQIKNGKKLEAPENPEISFKESWGDKPDTVGYIAAPNFEASKSKRFWLGQNYRSAWTAGLELPVLNMDTMKGGLHPIKKGGGLQTKSLRLEGADGKQYVLRSVYKDASLILPKFVQNTFIDSIFQDQMSMDHPFGAMIVPPLADAVGVYHTNPQFFYLPEQPRLGDFNDFFAGEAYLFEERPAKNREDVASFGRPKDIDSYRKMQKEIRESHDHFIDQEHTLYSRLFDIYIGDWDRHDDQWRWANFEEDGKKIYQPIPRDRDHAFLSFRGVFPWLISRKWGARQLHSFDHDIHDIAGLSFNARHFDRAYLNEQDLEDWISAAQDMRDKLTDEVIENAVRLWPDTLYQLNGAEIISKLKSRRDKLPEFAQEYYEFLAKEVDIIGTDEREYFEIIRMTNQQTKVTIYGMSDKKGNLKEKLYERIFDHQITKEIRLYGLKGDDKFLVKGESDKNILVRIIGGPGADEIKDESIVAGGKRTKIYDLSTEDNQINLGTEAKDMTQTDSKVNRYDRLAFKYPLTRPSLIPGINPDDGFFVGLGFTRITQGFRKTPYDTKHKLLGTYAFSTKAAGLNYTGEFIERIGSFDIILNMHIFGPSFVINYFGMGNNPIVNPLENREIDFYRIRFGQLKINPMLKKRFSLNSQNISFGLHYTLTDPTRNTGRISATDNDFISGLTDTDYEPQHYAGIQANYQIDKVDNAFNPTRGLRFNLNTSWNIDVQDANDYFHLNTDLSFYYTPFSPFPLTLAFRAGYAANFGDYEFYQANFLGRRTNLRGYNGERFGGDRAFYTNSEARLKLFKVSSFVLPFNVGILGYYDVGRVWQDDDPEGAFFEEWHPSWGGGLYLSPYDLIIISGTLTQSDEADIIELKFGFFF